MLFVVNRRASGFGSPGWQDALVGGVQPDAAAEVIEVNQAGHRRRVAQSEAPKNPQKSAWLPIGVASLAVIALPYAGRVMIRRGPFWLGPDPTFPPANLADAQGLLAVGGDLSTQRLLNAYRQGIFPWPIDEPDAPLLWFSPNPRFVLDPAELHVPRSLRRVLSSGRFDLRVDTAFESVMRGCAEATRHDQEGTWITPDMLEAYSTLRELGFAHSVEAWEADILAGGVYGLAIGGTFFAESMFFRSPNASKVALVGLITALRDSGFDLMDCQQESQHLARFGARAVPRQEFLVRLAVSVGRTVRFPSG